MKDAHYFKHDYNARGDEKIINLLRAHNLEGYGIYWCLIEKLYESDGKISADFDAIAYDLRTDPAKVKSIATKFGLFYLSGSSNRILGSKSVDRRLRERRERSIMARAAGSLGGRPPTRKKADANQKVSDRFTDHNLEEESREDVDKITAADRPPSAADLSKIADRKSDLIDDETLLSMQLPFGFGDIPRGRRVSDIDAVSAQAILDRSPRLGFNLTRALRKRVQIKKDESNKPGGN